MKVAIRDFADGIFEETIDCDSVDLEGGKDGDTLKRPGRTICRKGIAPDCSQKADLSLPV